MFQMRRRASDGWERWEGEETHAPGRAETKWRRHQMVVHRPPDEAEEEEPAFFPPMLEEGASSFFSVWRTLLTVANFAVFCEGLAPSSPAPASARPTFPIGSRVKTYWPLEKRFFYGNVVDTQGRLILYDDKDLEWHRADDLIAVAPRRARAASALRPATELPASARPFHHSRRRLTRAASSLAIQKRKRARPDRLGGTDGWGDGVSGKWTSCSAASAARVGAHPIQSSSLDTKLF